MNPVSALMLKTLLEDIPRSHTQLDEELQRVSAAIQRAVDGELRQFYQRDTDGAIPIAYLWARTITCDSCGAEIPLMRSFWLRKKENRRRALRYRVVRDQEPAQVVFEIFDPQQDVDVSPPTVSEAKAVCLCCNRPTAPERVRAQLATQNGGASTEFDASGVRLGSARLLAVVIKRENTPGRDYRLPNSRDYEVVWRADKQLANLLLRNKGAIPTEELSYNEIRRISAPLYGATQWHHLFTRRQCLTIASYQSAAREVKMTPACQRLVALAQDRLVMTLSAHCRWKATGESLIDMFGRHSIGMVWDFAEGTPGEGASSTFSNWCAQYGRLIRNLRVSYGTGTGQVVTADACNHPLSDGSCEIWFTDPPYYDSIPYGYLSDIFYVWLKRSGLREVMPTDFAPPVVPKEAECVVDRPHKLSKSLKNAKFFEEHIEKAAKEGRRITDDNGAACIVFAHKTTKGWEALLSGIIGSGWCITASWPIATELASRLNARDTASLATSVHLICRPRSEDAPIGDWGEVLRELP